MALCAHCMKIIKPIHLREKWLIIYARAKDRCAGFSRRASFAVYKPVRQVSIDDGLCCQNVRAEVLGEFRTKCRIK